MTKHRLGRVTWRGLMILGLLAIPAAGYSQTVLTGAMLFATNAVGADTNQAEWNTASNDFYWDLWLAQNPDASSPINGPSDALADIAIPLRVGSSHTFYMFAQLGSGGNFGFSAINLFFNGNSSVPGISVFAPLNNAGYAPNNSANTLTLAGATVAGAGASFYISGDAVIVLSEFNWNVPATPPGDVCQAMTFTPGDGADYFGSFTLHVFPAATVNLSQASGAPLTKLTATGGGFTPGETVEIFGGHIGAPPVIATAVADMNGSISAAGRVPQHALGAMDVYALGLSSHKLGATTLSVTPAVVVSPATVAPGGGATANVLGFGAGETVNVYWNAPRQLLGTGAANALGTAAVSIIIPANAAAGVDALIGVGSTTGAIGLGAVKVQ